MQPKMKASLLGLKLFLSAALVMYLFTMLDWERVRFVVPRLNYGYVWAPFFLLLLSVWVASIRWTALLIHFNSRQSVFESYRYYMISMFYGILLPGVLGGDAIRIALSIKKHCANRFQLAATVLLERTIGFFAILAIAAVTASLIPSLLQGTPAIVPFIYALPFTIVISLVFLRLNPPKCIERTRNNGHIVHSILDLFSFFRGLPLELLLLVLSLSIVSNVFDILGSFFLASALNMEQPLSLFLLIMPIVYVLTSLPISLGGLGVREGVLTYFLVKSGALASDAVLLSFLLYMNRILVSLLGGLAQFLDSRGSQSK